MEIALIWPEKQNVKYKIFTFSSGNLSENECRAQCSTNIDCINEALKVCDTFTGLCQECTGFNTGCTDPLKPKCTADRVCKG